MTSNLHEDTYMLSMTSFIKVITLWVFVGGPLSIIGGVGANRLSGSYIPLFRSKHNKREIPKIPWYSRPLQIIIGGLLPFSVIYVELHYMLLSLWGRTYFQYWGILLLVFVILILVTSLTNILLIYYQLSLEDYRWWWASFLSGGSTSLYMFGYSIYFYFFRTKMDGTLQAMFYFGYQFAVAYFFFVMLGTIGFYSSYFFVRKLYNNSVIK